MIGDKVFVVKHTKFGLIAIVDGPLRAIQEAIERINMSIIFVAKTYDKLPELMMSNNRQPLVLYNTLEAITMLEFNKQNLKELVNSNLFEIIPIDKELGSITIRCVEIT